MTVLRFRCFWSSFTMSFKHLGELTKVKKKRTKYLYPFNRVRHRGHWWGKIDQEKGEVTVTRKYSVHAIEWEKCQKNSGGALERSGKQGYEQLGVFVLQGYQADL